MAEPQPLRPAGRCPHCPAEPIWRIDRWGDAVATWACADHLTVECDALQRDWEVTQLIVSPAQKLQEWNTIGATLEEIALGVCHYLDVGSAAACADKSARRFTSYLEQVECVSCRLVIANRSGGSQVGDQHG